VGDHLRDFNLMRTGKIATVAAETVLDPRSIGRKPFETKPFKFGTKMLGAWILRMHCVDRAGSIADRTLEAVID
jgi:hypothetical protein